MDGSLLQAVFIFLAFTCLIVPLSKWAGLGPVIGYLIAGVLIGPFALGFISDPTTILHFSEHIRGKSSSGRVSCEPITRYPPIDKVLNILLSTADCSGSL